MSPYLKKQIIIVFVYLIIIGALGSGAYFGFIYSPPSCFDGKLNQGEEDIDCGGPCLACVGELVLPNVIWAKVFHVEEDLYDLAAQVENKNVNYGAEILPYVFKVYDSSNNLLLEKRGKSYIMPREKKYLIEVVSLNNVPQKATLDLEDIAWQKFKTDEGSSLDGDLNLPIFNSSLDLTQRGGYAARASGTIYNQTRFDLATIDINVVIYDSKGNPIAVNKAQKNTVKAREGRFFEVLWPTFGLIDASDAVIDMQGHTNIFSDMNFIRTFLEK